MVECKQLSCYRPTLATKTSAAAFRDIIEKGMASYAGVTKRDGMPRKEWVFWDHRDVNLDKIRIPKALTLAEEAEELNDRATMKEQVHDIEKIIKIISHAGVAKAHEGRAAIASQVHDVLETLVEVSNIIVSDI